MRNNITTVEGIDISFIEINATAPYTLFFIHGNSCSSSFWRKQTGSPLFSNYRMIAFDLPWHGKSGLPDWSDCSLTGLARVMSEAVKNLIDDKPYMLAGASLGTNVVAEMLYNDLQPDGVILAGPCLLGKNHALDNMVKKGTHVSAVFTSDAPEEDILTYAGETSLSKDPDDIRAFLDDYRNTNKQFRSTLAASLENYREQVDIFRQKNVSSLIVFGADEKIIHPDYLDGAELPLWGGKIYKLKGASHLVNIDQPDRFNDLVSDYVKDIFK